MRVVNKKSIIIFILCLLFFVFFTHPSFASTVNVTGKAKVLNTNKYLDFTSYNSNVKIDDATGNFVGYAFLEDIGWIAFGSVDNTLGPINVNLINGTVTGKAKALTTGKYLDFTNYGSNVTANITTGVFSGYVFSEDVGWLNFADTGVTSSTTLDIVSPLDFSLNSPDDNSYTNQERPSFKWQATSDTTAGLSKYNLDINIGSADITISDIPPNKTTDYSTSKYIASYENVLSDKASDKHLSLITKSTSDWGANQNDGKLKEGKNTWKVKAIDSIGNEKSYSRTLFADFTPPKTEIKQINNIVIAIPTFASGEAIFPSNNFATTDTTPTIYGKIIDRLTGGDSSSSTQNDKGPKVASGPKEINIKFEKLNWNGIYDLVMLSKINLTQNKWTQTDKEITDNNLNTSDKYSPFSYTPSEKLEFGKYKITITGMDKANNSANNIFYLTIGGFNEIASLQEQQAIDQSSQTQTEKQIIKEEFTKEIIPSPSPPDQTQSSKPSFNLFASIQSMLNNTWNKICQIISPATQALIKFTGKQSAKLASVLEIIFDQTPTLISNVEVKNISSTQAIISWETNHYAKNNKINFGETTTYGKEAFDLNLSKNHQITISNLNPNTKYFFEVMSQNKNYVFDAFHEFTTLSK